MVHAGSYDLILANPDISGFNGAGVLETIHSTISEIPVIVITHLGIKKVTGKPGKDKNLYFFIKTPDFVNKLPNTILSVLEGKTIVKHYKKEQEELLRQYRYACTLKEVSRMALRSMDRDELLKKICKMINVTLEGFAWVGLTDKRQLL